MVNTEPMTKPIVLYTVGEIISALGGPTAAATWAGMGVSGICNWEVRGIPPGWHYRLDRHLRKLGYEVHPTVFGCPEDDSTPTAREDARLQQLS